MGEASESAEDPRSLTRALGALAGGGADARPAAVRYLDRELRAIARGFLRAGRADVEATELVNDAYLKLFDREQLDLTDRKHFFALAAVAMRQILVDQARRRGRKKRAGDQCAVTLTNPPDPSGGAGAEIDVLDLDAALEELAQRDAVQARIVELRWFTGLEVTEVADVLDVSKSTVERQWRVARAWLAVRLDGHGPARGPEPAP